MSMDRLDPTDLALLDGFQRDLPLVSRPFAAHRRDPWAERGRGHRPPDRACRPQAAIARVGGTVRPNTAGASTLAALAVPEGRIEEVAAMVGAEPGVNHSYLREADWNLWFVATAPDAPWPCRARWPGSRRATGLAAAGPARLSGPSTSTSAFRCLADRLPCRTGAASVPTPFVPMTARFCTP